MSRAIACSTSSTPAPSSVTGSPRARSSSRTCSRRPSLPGQPQRREQPEPDRLAVAVAGVAGARSRSRGRPCGRGSAPGGARRRARRRRRPRASCARTRGSSARRPPRPPRRASHSAPPAISAVFSTSTQPAASSAGGQARQRVGVDEHARRLVVGADVVLRLGQVDAGLAAVGRVDLGDQRGRHLHDRHPALVGRRAEAREVADDAAAERDDVVGARSISRGQQLAPHPLRRSRASCAPRPRRDRERSRRARPAARRTGAPRVSSVTQNGRETRSVERPQLRRSPRACRAQQAAADAAPGSRPRRELRPQQPRARRRRRQRAQRAAARAAPRRARARGTNASASSSYSARRARVQATERLAVARERAAPAPSGLWRAADPLPGELPASTSSSTVRCGSSARAHALGADAAAAERDHRSRLGGVEQLAARAPPRPRGRTPRRAARTPARSECPRRSSSSSSLSSARHAERVGELARRRVDLPAPMKPIRTSARRGAGA